MKDGTLETDWAIVDTMFAGAKLTKVLASAWTDIGEKLEGDSPHGNIADGYVEEYNWVGVFMVTQSVGRVSHGGRHSLTEPVDSASR